MADYTSVAATAWPVTLAECKAHLNVSHATDDEYIEGLIKAATATLEARTRRCFVHQTRTLKMDSFYDGRYVHGRRIFPDRSPIANSSGVAISYVDSVGTTTTLPTSEYRVNYQERPGNISEAYNETWPDTRVQSQAVTVTYTAGHGSGAGDIPYNIKLAVQQVVAHWYRNRESHVDLKLNELPMAVEALLESEHIETYV
jgi:uncharacterized phiE125 gp8 family phage protein